MDVLNNRYANFKAFCTSILPDNEFVKMLQLTPLEMFMDKIKANHQANKTVDEIVALTFDMAKIDTTKLNEADIQKFHRYVEYFTEVLKSLA